MRAHLVRMLERIGRPVELIKLDNLTDKALDHILKRELDFAIIHLVFL